MDLEERINKRAKEIEASFPIDVEAVVIDVEEDGINIYVSWIVFDKSTYDITDAQIRNFDEKLEGVENE